MLSLLVVALLGGVGCTRKSTTPKDVSVSRQPSGQAFVDSAAPGTVAPAPVAPTNVNTRVGVSPAPAPTPTPAPTQNALKVLINGQALSQAQINEFEEAYGQKPDAGNYWYDAKSGLYGAVGYQAFGFMLPGHSYGRLSRTASNGNAGVFINSRELPQAEWLIWGQIVGAPIQIGSYWLDAQGNAGYEGSDIPIINLYLAALANSYGGGGGGGDNFWSSRFSAGNYNADNSQGYVSVPGVGPVGYGF